MDFDSITYTANVFDFLDNNDGSGAIYNYFDDTIVMGTTGDDMIVNRGEGVTVNGNGGSDSIVGLKVNDVFMVDGERLPIGATEYSTIVVSDGRRNEARIFDVRGETLVAWTGWDGMLDRSGVTVGEYLIANVEDSTVISGSGNDTIDLRADEVKIMFTGGRDVVHGFNETDAILLDHTGGIILSDADRLRVAQTADGLKLSDGGNSLLLYDVRSTPILFTNGNETIRAAYVADGDDIQGASSIDAYNGLTRNTGVDFGLEYDPLYIDADGGTFNSIGRVTLGASDSTFKGGKHRETITAGVGDDVIYLSKGRDVIRNFDVENDRLAIDDEFTVKVKGADILIKANDGASALLVDLATVDAGISINDRLVKAGAVMTYDETVTDYVGSTNATLNVEGDADIWLGLGNFDNVRTVDASDSNGDVLIAGSDKSDLLIGGYGDNSLWGGVGGRDTLIGGEGTNEFYYGLGNGIDTFQNADDDDIIDLLGITLDDIRSVDVTDNSVNIKFTDGGRLYIDSTADLTYRINGAKFKLNRASSTFVQK